MKTLVTYRVRPEYLGFSAEDFELLEDAVKRANHRNSLRPREGYDGETFYKGDNCIIQKVTTTVEEITF